MLSLILYPVNLYNYVSIKHLVFAFLGRLCYYNNDSFFNSIAVHNFNPYEGRINLSFNSCCTPGEAISYPVAFVSVRPISIPRERAGLLSIVYLNYTRGQFTVLK